jgi:hypothetical protein
LAGIGGYGGGDQRGLRGGQLTSAQCTIHPGLVGQPLRGGQGVLGHTGRRAAPAGQLLGRGPGAAIALMGRGHPAGQQRLSGCAESLDPIERTPQLPRGGTADRIRIQPVDQNCQSIPDLESFIEHVCDASGSL